MRSKNAKTPKDRGHSHGHAHAMDQRGPHPKSTSAATTVRKIRQAKALPGRSRPAGQPLGSYRPEVRGESWGRRPEKHEATPHNTPRGQKCSTEMLHGPQPGPRRARKQSHAETRT